MGPPDGGDQRLKRPQNPTPSSLLRPPPPQPKAAFAPKRQRVATDLGSKRPSQGIAQPNAIRPLEEQSRPALGGVIRPLGSGSSTTISPFSMSTLSSSTLATSSRLLAETKGAKRPLSGASSSRATPAGNCSTTVKRPMAMLGGGNSASGGGGVRQGILRAIKDPAAPVQKVHAQLPKYQKPATVGASKPPPPAIPGPAPSSARPAAPASRPPLALTNSAGEVLPRSAGEAAAAAASRAPAVSAPAVPKATEDATISSSTPPPLAETTAVGVVPPPPAAAPVGAVADTGVREDSEDASEEAWRQAGGGGGGETSTVSGGEGKKPGDIRSYFSAKPPPPPIKCPLMPAPPIVEAVPARHWRHIMRCYQADIHRRATRAAVLRLVWSRLGVLPSSLSTTAGSTSTMADPATWLEFDALGSLLAVGSLNGVVRIFDFDEYLHTPSLQFPGTAASAPPPPTDPIQVLFPKKGISVLRWHPDKSAELACAFSHWNQVYVYDLEAWAADPTRIYEIGHRAKGSAGGNLSLTFARHSEARGGGCFMVAGSAYGMLRCWDMRRTERLLWEVKLRWSQAITTLASSGNYLVASCADSVIIYDVHHLQVPCMGAEPAPTLLWTLEGLGPISGLRPRPGPLPHMLAITSTAHMIRFDLSTGKVVSRSGLGGRSSRVDAAFFGAMGGSEMALLCNQDEPLRVSMHELQPCLDSIRGDGISNQPMRFRRPPDTDEDDKRSSLFTLTLPGFVTAAVEGENWVRSSCTTLHHFLAPRRASATFKSRRACSIMIAGRCYDIEDLEVAQGVTTVSLTTAFHVTVTSSDATPIAQGRVTIQAPLEPEEHRPPLQSSTWGLPSPCIIDLPSPFVTAMAMNINSNHVVTGMADGSLAVLGVRPSKGSQEEEGNVEDVDTSLLQASLTT